MEPNNDDDSPNHVVNDDGCVITSNNAASVDVAAIAAGVVVDSSKNKTDKNSVVVVDNCFYIPLLPWNVIIEFFTIQDILQLRVVSKIWNIQIINDNVSPNLCAKYLSSILLKQNLYLLTNTNTKCCQWMDFIIHPTNVNKLTHMLSTSSGSTCSQPPLSPPPQQQCRRKQQKNTTDSGMTKPRSVVIGDGHNNNNKNDDDGGAVVKKTNTNSTNSNNSTTNTDTTNSTTPLRTLLRILRIVQYIPEQAAIVFNKIRGRHVLPMIWNENETNNNIMMVRPIGNNQKAKNITTTTTPRNNNYCQRRIPTTTTKTVVARTINTTSITGEDKDDENTTTTNNDNDMSSSSFLIPTPSPPYPSNDIDDYFIIPASSSSSTDAAAFLASEKKTSLSSSTNEKTTPAAHSAVVTVAAAANGDSVPTTTSNQHETFFQEILDLKHYYNTNVPNLPNDLSCPRCGSAVLVNEIYNDQEDQRQQQEDVKKASCRSLVLSEISYQSSSSSKLTATVGDDGGDIASPCHVELTLTPQLLNGSKQNNHRDQTCGVNSHLDKKVSGEIHQTSSHPCDTEDSFYEDKDGDAGDIDDDDGSVQFDSLFTSSPSSTVPRKRPKIDGIDGEDTKQMGLEKNGKIGGGKSICARPTRRKEKEIINNGNLEGKEKTDVQHKKPDFAQLPTFPPPMYCDMAIPCRTTPIPYKPDNKHAISLHCTSCNEFGILAPASICWDPNFPCHQRGMYLTDRQQDDQDPVEDNDGHQASMKALATDPSINDDDGKNDGSRFRRIDPTPTMVGGMIVRTRCSTAGCNRPTLCWQCHHSIWHHPYDDGGTNWMNYSQANLGSPTVRHSSHCPSCRETYCHEHAWLCTICHHW